MYRTGLFVIHYNFCSVQKVQHPSLVYGDNKSVLANASMPDSVLKKKAHSIAYNFVREGVVKKEWLLAYVSTKDNIADFLTKPLSGEQRIKLIQQVIRYKWLEMYTL